MKIIVGHSNMDLDCIGSIVLARYLYPGFRAVKSRFIHPVARNLQNLYQNHLDFLNPKDLKGESIETMVIVDTRSRERVKEYLKFIADGPKEVIIYDHHPDSGDDFPGALIHENPSGANTTQLGEEIIKQGITLKAEDATIALAGIYADTGNFTHENVTPADLRVASYLLKAGASLKLIKTFLKPLSAQSQITLFHEVLNGLEYREVHGHRVVTCYMEAEEESQGLGAVAEKVFEVEDPDVFFGVFHFTQRKKTLIIGRNGKSNIYLNEILADFGGGGHSSAASAIVKNQDGPFVYRNLISYLDKMLVPAVTAEEIMSRPVHTVEDSLPLIDASRYLERLSHTGVPVVDKTGALTGFLTLRDIMKGRRSGQMHAPVKGYMSKNVVTAESSITIREVEEIMFRHNIGHLPLMRQGVLYGIVTRSDYLAFKRTARKKRQAVIGKMGLELPG